MALLYDSRGRELDLAALRKEHADAERNNRLQPATESVASTLTPERLATLIRAADEGDLDAYLTLAEEMEEREPQYRSTLSQRKFAVCSSEVVVKPASSSAEDVRLADEVRELVEEDAFQRFVFHLQDALGKCYSIVELIWDTEREDGRWWIEDYRWRDPHWYRLDTRTLSALRLEDGSADGEPLPPYKYAVHHPLLKSGLPARGGLARLVAIAYVAKRYTTPQLVRFLEVMGIPARIARYEGLNEAERNDLLRQLRKLGTDAAAIIPKSVDIELLESKGRGGPAEFVTALNWWDAQISKAVVGQTMTTDAGASRSQSDTHYSVRIDFTQHDNRQTSATINRDVVVPFILLNHGPQKRYPKVLLRCEEAEDVAAWSTAVTQFVDRGLAVDQREVRAKLGLSEPKEGAPLLEPGVGAGPQGPKDKGAEDPSPEPEDPAPTPAEDDDAED